jgi:hypothetical protein
MVQQVKVTLVVEVLMVQVVEAAVAVAQALPVYLLSRDQCRMVVLAVQDLSLVLQEQQHIMQVAAVQVHTVQVSVVTAVPVVVAVAAPPMAQQQEPAESMVVIMEADIIVVQEPAQVVRVE